MRRQRPAAGLPGLRRDRRLGLLPTGTGGRRGTGGFLRLQLTSLSPAGLYEAVKDPLGNKIGSDVAEVVLPAAGNRAIGVVDPFAGSCNGLCAILRHLPGAKGIGFEVEPAVFDLTTRNIAHINAPIELVNGSYKDLVRSRTHPTDHLVVVFIAPPWSDALQPDTGLHLDLTKPPILEIVHDFEQVYGAQPVLYVIEVHEVNEPKALKTVEAAFDWSDLRIYDVNAPGLQHGVLLGTRRWPS